MKNKSPQTGILKSPEPRIPLSTYRLQFNSDFTFHQARAIVPYLSALGISHLYASPYLKARPGSRHGYDIIDHNALNPEIGTDDEFERLCETLIQYGMGQVLDVVPNHMGVLGGDNVWWLDVLENGQTAVHAGFFDIDWAPIKVSLHGKVLLPVLGNHYGAVPENAELQLRFDSEHGEFGIYYFEHHFPVDPEQYPLRSEDMRARLNVLSEIPAAWRLALRHWSRANRSLKHRVDGMLVPTLNDEYFIYQTLLGIWPPGEPSGNEMALLGVRLQEYLVKAAREAKVYTSWINSNTAYEDAVVAFAIALINEPAESAFMTDFRPFQRRIAWLGMFNSPSKTLIRFSVPGVPDMYQSCECWDFSLADPDNRRSVDFVCRRTMLDDLQNLATLERSNKTVDCSFLINLYLYYW